MDWAAFNAINIAANNRIFLNYNSYNVGIHSTSSLFRRRYNKPRNDGKYTPTAHHCKRKVEAEETYVERIRDQRAQEGPERLKQFEDTLDYYLKEKLKRDRRRDRRLARETKRRERKDPQRAEITRNREARKAAQVLARSFKTAIPGSPRYIPPQNLSKRAQQAEDACTVNYLQLLKKHQPEEYKRHDRYLELWHIEYEYRRRRQAAKEERRRELKEALSLENLAATFFPNLKLKAHSDNMDGKHSTAKMTPVEYHIANQQPTDNGIAKILEARNGSYNINNAPVSHERVAGIVAESIAMAPTPDQTSRMVILFNKDHQAFAEIVRSVAANKKDMNKERSRIEVLDKAYGTILFFTDLSPLPVPVLEGSTSPPAFVKPDKKVVENHIQRQKYLVWTALEKEGVGASLQDYDHIDKQVATRWTIPESWNLKGELVFGAFDKAKELPMISQRDAKQKLMVFPPIVGFANGHGLEECSKDATAEMSSPSKKAWFKKG